jgi:hypothetical protein
MKELGTRVPTIGSVKSAHRGEKILGEVISMGKGTIHSRLILDIRKKTDGCNVDLDETELSLLVGRVPN